MLIQLMSESEKLNSGKIINILNSNNINHKISDAKDKILILNTVSEDIIQQIKVFLDLTQLEPLDSKFKLTSRKWEESDSLFTAADTEIGGNIPTLIAGPCAVESRQQMFDIVGSLVESGVKIIRGGAFKPRTSPYSFQGLEEKGIEILLDVKKHFGVGIITELTDSSKIDTINAVADIIQIGSRNMHNFDLLKRVGKLHTPVMLKRGMTATLEEFLLSAEYIMNEGNNNIILCERGIRTFETATRNTLDLNAVPWLREKSHLPVFVDPSHGIGIRSMVEPMALAGIACGANGLIVEVHNNPDNALSDGAQSLTLPQFKQLKERVNILSESIKTFN